MSCALNSLVDGEHQSLSVDFYSKNRQAYEALSYARDKTDRFQSGAVIPIQRFGEFLSEEGDLSKLNERLTRFNLFAALGAAEYEARHSDFLAWLLNPSGTHGCGAGFLLGFLEQSKKAARKQNISIPDLGFSKFLNPDAVVIRREYQGIDLFIEEKSNRFACVIENKIHTGEHSNQLARYREKITRLLPGYNFLFVFLTLKDEPPSDSAYVGLTYQQVSNLLGKMAGKPSKVSLDDVKSILLRHYIRFITDRHSTGNHGANLFDALGLREIKHSDFWSWLLNPKESHGLGVSPLQEFLSKSVMGLKSGNDWSRWIKGLTIEKLDDLEIYREKHNIDLLLVSEREQFVCLIENKLESREGKDQLKRYKSYVQLWYPEFRILPVFFTLNGDKASDEEFASISYSAWFPTWIWRERNCLRGQ